MTPSPLIRRYTPADAEAIAAIIDHFATNTFVSYNSQPYGKMITERFNTQTDDYPNYVVEVDGKVVGSGGLRPVHPGDTVKQTGEIGYSFLPEFTGRGLGSLLLERIETDARTLGMISLVASISSRNEQSIAFHLKHGFVECGRFKRAGIKFDQEFDIVWMQKML
jgi:phosphinothricin acetyltransferase